MRIIFYVALTALAACVTSQCLKLIFNAIIDKKCQDVSNIFQDGSFPSSHSAYTTSVTVISWINVISNMNTEEVSIYIWIACAVTAYTSVVIRDALGVRYTVQKLCDAILCMIDENEDKSSDKLKHIANRLNKKSGHEPYEVVGGVVWGALVGMFAASIYYENVNIIAYIIPVMLVFVFSAYWYVRIKRKRKTDP